MDFGTTMTQEPAGLQAKGAPGRMMDRLAEIIRFGAAGILITLMSAIGYWLLAEFAKIQPNLALLMVFVVMSTVGYFLHLRFSFRKTSAGSYRSAFRYILVAIFGFLLNNLFIWLLTDIMSAPVWTPTVPMVLVTPVVSYLLLQYWVYRDHH